MQNSTYVPKRFEDLNSDTCMLNSQGLTHTATAGVSTNLDYKLLDDHILTGLELLANSSNFGDTTTLQVVDKDLMLQGIYGAGITTMYPAYPVLRQFGTNINLPSDTQLKINKQGVYPARIITGLYLRLIYNSTGSTDVSVAVNYVLHKLLV